MRRTQDVGRWVLVAVVGALVLAAGATAQAPPPDPTLAGPSLRIVTADLRRVGDDLRLRLRLSRAVPEAEMDSSQGRFACLILGPSVDTRRRACVSRKSGRLRVTLSAIDVEGNPSGSGRVLPGARVEIADDVLVLRASMSSLRVRPRGLVGWQALVSWKDGGPCEQSPEPTACSQLVPQTGERVLRSGSRSRPRPRTRPGFARGGRLRLLATGDSMIQIIDSFLEQRLERRRATSVRSDARISTGLSRPSGLNWVKKAREQARSVHPDVTAVFIGANDGFAMKTRSGASAPCCDAAWVAEYARRVESMMRSYTRGGRSLVYWLTLPAPNRNDFARIYRAVNAAIRRAGARVGAGARVIDLVPVFTPGGRFRQHVRFRGKTVNARQADGVHLSTAGASIAATLLIDRLRADHALPSAR